MMYFLILGILSLIAGIVAGQLIRLSKSNVTKVNKLLDKVTNKNNLRQVNQLVTYHNSRIAAGANEDESLARLTKELNRLVSRKE